MTESSKIVSLQTAREKREGKVIALAKAALAEFRQKGGKSWDDLKRELGLDHD